MRLYEPDFPVPVPLFDLFLSCNRNFHGTMKLIIDEFVDVVSLGETVGFAFLVLINALNQATRHSNVKYAIVLVCEYLQRGGGSMHNPVPGLVRSPTEAFGDDGIYNMCCSSYGHPALICASARLF